MWPPRPGKFRVAAGMAGERHANYTEGMGGYSLDMYGNVFTSSSPMKAPVEVKENLFTIIKSSYVH